MENKAMVGLPSWMKLFGLTSATGMFYIMMNFATSCSRLKRGCIKCSLDNGQRLGPPLNLAGQETILRSAKDAGALAMVVIGHGEPTENPEIVLPAIEAAHRLGLVSIIFTTLEALTEGMASFFATHGVSLFTSLDSLNRETYRKLAGVDALSTVLRNMQALRAAYDEQPDHNVMVRDTRLVRLGINTTVSVQNLSELATMRDFAGDDLLYIANPPMPHGRLEHGTAWQRLISTSRLTRRTATFSDEWYRLEAAAQAVSNTGGHSSLYGGLCGYGHNGFAIQSDGREMRVCGYGEAIGDPDTPPPNWTSKLILERFEVKRRYMASFDESLGRSPSCPLRDEAYDDLIAHWPM